MNEQVEVEAASDSGEDDYGDTGIFTPTNPCLRGILGLFSDEKTSDIMFDVGSKEKFYAHRLILRACAPTLAEYCDGADEGEDVKSVIITGVEPEIFRHLLRYVYGGAVDIEVLRNHSREIINAADRFGIGSLKVEAEGYYVESTPITLDNFAENLQFSDAKKCSLLKERVMDFLVQNETTALQKLSQQDVPQSESMLTDFLTASARQKRKRTDDGDLNIMPINQMRKLLDSTGLNVDGTREMLTRDIKKTLFVGDGDVLVAGAGSQEINGMYTKAGSHDGVPKYTKDIVYEGRDKKVTLYRWRERKWYISIIPRDGPPGSDDDIDFYVGPCHRSEVIPLMTGWSCIARTGIQPPPLILTVKLPKSSAT
eukprot:CAMPEP_0181085514 /NCGR_PEP_ID=MMETSP1071-20121207/5270_1 /TAXON_ID=35127 /ORGANISM="Thalassiosira sp., Strain NH16" /LENGTH=368 /DNA_ID=CAMNT_0023167321 /DNA_START=83 /DNA_END=1189 /DNA_ORIENTATION=+